MGNRLSISSNFNVFSAFETTSLLMLHIRNHIFEECCTYTLCPTERYDHKEYSISTVLWNFNTNKQKKKKEKRTQKGIRIILCTWGHHCFIHAFFFLPFYLCSSKKALDKSVRHQRLQGAGASRYEYYFLPKRTSRNKRQVIYFKLLKLSWRITPLMWLDSN